MDDRYADIETNHGRFRLVAIDHVEHQLRRWGAHERSDLTLLLSLLHHDDVVHDIGAHVGTYAIPMGRTIRRHGCAGYVYDIVAVHRDDPLLDGVIVASEGRRASRDAKSQVSAVASPGA